MSVALRVGKSRRAATRMSVSIGVAVLVVMATIVRVPVSSASASDVPSPDKTALIMGPSFIPTPDDAYVQSVKNQFIVPTHPGQDIEYIKVTTPEEIWPISGLGRLALLALGPPSLWGLGGPAWPDEPLWKLSGLFDLTLDQSILQGVKDLEDAMAKNGNDDLVIFGYSQSALSANRVKLKLAEQYPAGTEAPNIDFVFFGDPNLPNGGTGARLWGIYLPIIDWYFNGPAPTDTQFKTIEITRQYDGFADFPLYPLNVISLFNAVLGLAYAHSYPFDVSLPPDPEKSKYYQGTHGDTSYYFFPTQDLPLFGPLRTLGVPEPVIDVVEPFFKVIVDLGYDRSIKPWEPTPARLIPPLHPVTVATDLLNAIGEGINNALALTGLPPLLSVPAPDTTNTTGASGTNTTGVTTLAASGTNTTGINTTAINTTGASGTLGIDNTGAARTDTLGTSGTHTTGIDTTNASGTNTVAASGSNTVAASGSNTIGASGSNTVAASGSNTIGASGTNSRGTNRSRINTTDTNTIDANGTHTTGASSTNTTRTWTGTRTGTSTDASGTGVSTTSNPPRRHWHQQRHERHR